MTENKNLKRVTGEVTPEIKGKLKERAETQNINLSELVGEILTKEFKQEGKIENKIRKTSGKKETS